jgi:phosphoglycolate phosphatase-like HAD superfamily hydrolase
LKILSDFDGVLTDLSEEAARVRSLFEARLCEGSSSAAEVLRALTALESHMLLTPQRFGWKIKGRIAAFCNEDSFILTNALAAFLEDLAEQSVEPWPTVRENLATQGIASYYELALQCYTQMTQETSRGERHPLDPLAVPFIRRALEAGISFVVVSNSSTDRICEILQREGLPAVAHESNPQAPLRIRGGAGKFVLGEHPTPFRVKGYDIDLDRPRYETILLEERPDWVIGDVFSLDLALPLSMRERNLPGFDSLRVWLRQRSYSPSWVLEFLSEDNVKGVKGGAFQRFDELGSFGLPGTK